MTQAELTQICRQFFVREFDTRDTLSLLNRYGYRFWSWGANKFTNLANKGLLFKVQGHHHKGYVLITLNGGDLYDVRLITTTGKIKDTMTDLYFDQLFDAIDEKVEKLPNYTS
jgi:hypothetical protein